MLTEAVATEAVVTGAWQRSSYCADSSCVEVAPADDFVKVRDGKRTQQPPLTLPRADWHAFLDDIAAGNFRDHI